tara:strand:- start:2052 stop:2753 length:702 start_codon:yes stop_codon:yes gene_type:complete
MMGAMGITNKGPINTPTTGQGAIAGFDPIMKLHRRAVKSRKKRENAGKQWEHRREDPTYIDGRSKQARKLIKRLSKRKKMAEAVIKEEEKSSGGGENTSQAYKFISQKRKVQKKQEREKRAANRKQEIQMISRAKSSDYQKKAKDRQKKLSSTLKKENFGDGLVYLESLCEQIESENTNPTHYFFADETELELTQEQASVIIDKFNQLSEQHKDTFVNMIPDSKEILTTFMTM